MSFIFLTSDDVTSKTLFGQVVSSCSKLISGLFLGGKAERSRSEKDTDGLNAMPHLRDAPLRGSNTKVEVSPSGGVIVSVIKTISCHFVLHLVCMISK